MGEDALPGLDEDGVVRLHCAFGDGGADHLEGLGSTGPAPGLEVDLPDREVCVVRERARRVVVRQAAEDHHGLAALALREMELALQEHRLRAELGVVRLFRLLELGERLVEDALVGVVPAELE